MRDRAYVSLDSFPVLREKPPVDALLACVGQLRLTSSASDDDTDNDDDNDDKDQAWDWSTPRAEIEAHHAAAALAAQRDAAAVARYLERIVGSDLAWIADEDQREQLWTAASRRLAERCGRTAMGDLTRRWPFELRDCDSRCCSCGGGGGTRTLTLPGNGPASGHSSVWTSASSSSNNSGISTPLTMSSSSSSLSPSSGTAHCRLDLFIREPALVGDDLGLKTWGTSYAMARMLPQLAHRNSHLQRLLRPATHSSTSNQAAYSSRPRILELGAGTGLLGLAAAALLRADVLLTDLPAIVPNLASNVARNAAAIEARGGRAQTAVLAWGRSTADDNSNSNSNSIGHQRFPLVLAADPIYDDDHPTLLADAIDSQLLLSTAVTASDETESEAASQDVPAHTDTPTLPDAPAARVMVMVPLRDQHTHTLAQKFVDQMAGRGLVVADQGEIVGQDSDWGGGNSTAGRASSSSSAQFACRWWLFRRE